MKAIGKVLVLLAILAGCASVQTGPQQIETACAASSTAIKALTVANNAGKLSPAQRDQVLHAINLIDPICKAPAPPTLDAARQSAFLAAVAALESAKAGVKP